MLSDFRKTAGKLLPNPIMDWWHTQCYRRRKNLDPAEYRGALAKWYRAVMGRELDLETPQTLTEKIQWLKLWDSTELKGSLADKYLSRGYVADRIGAEHLVPLVVDKRWMRSEDIPLSEFPNQYVLKLTTGSGRNLFVDGYSQKPNIGEVERFFAKSLEIDYAFLFGFELHYSFIEPAIIAEKYIESSGELVDYRFFCSYGKVFSIWADTGSWNHDYHRTVFDTEWDVVDVVATHPRHAEPPEKPTRLEEMTEYASILSRDFSLVRVDFYENDGKVLFGEMTFTPQSGTMRFSDSDFDEYLGSFVQLPTEKKPFKGVIL